MDRQTVATGTDWESKVGYSRAVRVGSHIHVSGTTATDEEGDVVGVGDPYRQTRRALANIESALAEAGAALDDVVRTRLFVVDIDRWEEIGKAHGEVFGEIRPATSMVEVRRLIDPTDPCKGLIICTSSERDCAPVVQAGLGTFFADRYHADRD